ncbi:MAG: acyltransferase family protein [Lacibacter sp.]
MNELQKTADQQTSLLNTKTHFQLLDGLRGVAAVAVVVFHFMEIAVPDFTVNFIAHGYLAVDFFFCLSGFVIAYAYDKRIAGLSLWQFFKLRLIRLQPLVVIGAVLGLLTFLFDPFHNLYAAKGPLQTILMFLSAALLIPYPSIPERYNNLFYMNAPVWSLFWEYIANIAYALLFWKMNRNMHKVLLAAAALLLIWSAFHYGHLSTGWGADTYPGGGIRVLFSFVAGMMVYRFNWIIKNKLSFPVLALMLLASFLLPFVESINKVTEPLLVIFYFPLLIALAAGTQVKPMYERICKFSGDISYPLYMIHYPFIWVYLSYMEVYKPSMDLLKILIPLFTVVLMLMAWLTMKYIDYPIRRYLAGKKG